MYSRGDVILPEVIVTDLDGPFESILKANQRVPSR